MTEQPGGGMPAEDAARASKPPAEARNVLDTAAEKPGSSGLTAAEERELAKLQEKRDAAQARDGGVRMRVEGPHSELHYGGFVVGREYVTVPEHLVAGFGSAAQDAGVELTTEES